MKKLIVVAQEDSGMRIDVWLCKRLAGVSRKRVKKLLDSGGVRVGGKRVFIAGWKLKANDKVEVAEEARGDIKGGYVKIIYEDDDIIVVDKPAGMLSVTDKASIKQDLESQVKAYLKRRFKTGSYLKALHRLDAETSGAVVFAKSRAGEKLEEMFRRHAIERRYVALVEGAVKNESGRIDAPIEKGEFQGGRKAREAKGKGRAAITEYRVKERYSDATLLEITVRTGRTHQIRVHLSGIGHPVIGDKLYGAGRPFARQALHASSLGFRHPVGGRKMRFESPLPNDLMRLVDELRGG